MAKTKKSRKNEEVFEWTESAAINLQYITTWIMCTNLANTHDFDEMYSVLYHTADMAREWAKEFSRNEPDWEESETDYESVIEEFCSKKYREDCY